MIPSVAGGARTSCTSTLLQHATHGYISQHAAAHLPFETMMFRLGCWRSSTTGTRRRTHALHTRANRPDDPGVALSHSTGGGCQCELLVRGETHVSRGRWRQLPTKTRCTLEQGTTALVDAGMGATRLEAPTAALRLTTEVHVATSASRPLAMAAVGNPQ